MTPRVGAVGAAPGGAARRRAVAGLPSPRDRTPPFAARRTAAAVAPRRLSAAPCRSPPAAARAGAAPPTVAFRRVALPTTNDRPSPTARASIESDAATLLGLLSLEFARLDTALGMCVVWADGGRQLDELTRRFETASFDDKVAFLRKTVDRRFGDADPAREAYTAWLARADDARRVRTHLLNGRVGFDPDTGRVVSVIGLPTSQDRRTRRYALDELRTIVGALRTLHADLGVLRERHPL